MKKYILALLVLLFLLILTCVYLKTSVFYEKNHDNTILPIVKKETTALKVKEKKTEKEIVITKAETKVLPKPIAKQKPSPVTVPSPATTKPNDIEKIDSLMQALKERETAFKNRDEFELHLQELIKQALENRSTAIAHMNREELHLLELQKELLKTRDIAYDKIGQTNTPTSGE